MKCPGLKGVALAIMVPGAVAAQDCATDLEVTPIGALTVTVDGAETVREFLKISVADFVFGDVEAFTSAAYLREPSAENPEFHIWSLTAYPQGYGDELHAALCGEDLLDVLDTYAQLAAVGGLTGGALTGVSPNLRASRAFFEAQMRSRLDGTTMAEVEAGWAAIDAFEARLPDRTGAMQLNLRRAKLDPMAIVTNPDLTPSEVMAKLAEIEAGDPSAILDDPATAACPCEMEVVEVHIYDAPAAPPYGQSLSWGTADARKVPFQAVLETIENRAGGYAISGSFSGGLRKNTPDPDNPGLMGAPGVTKDETVLEVRGSFDVDPAMAGGLARIPKLF